MKPPTRKRKKAAKAKDLPVEEYSRWTLPERKRLLKALEKYPSNQISEIAKEVSTKSEAEVIFYLKKLKRSLRFEIGAAENIMHRKYIKNIEAWIRFTHQLVDDEEEKYSTMIGKLLALFGEYCFKRGNPLEGVNFKAIYDYISGLLLGVRLPVLPPLEAALVMDLLKNLATFLAQSDLTAHKRFVLSTQEKHLYSNLSPTPSTPPFPSPPPQTHSRPQTPPQTHSRPQTPPQTPPPQIPPQTPPPPPVENPDVIGKNKESILRRLLVEVPFEFPPSMSHPPKKSSTPKKLKKTYEHLSDGTLVTIVSYEDEIASQQTKSTPVIQESELSKNPQPKMKLSSNSSNSVRGKSAPSEIEISIVGNEKYVQQDPEVIPSTSEKIKPDLYTEDSVLAQQDPKIVSVEQDPKVIQPIKTTSGISITPVQKRQSSIADPKKNNNPQVPSEDRPLSSREIVQNSKDCTSVSQLPNRDTIQEIASSSSADKEPSKANVLSNTSRLFQVLTEDTILPFPNSDTVAEEQDGTSDHQLLSGTTTSNNILSLSHEPLTGTVKQEINSANFFQVTDSGLVSLESSPQKTNKEPVHQKTNSPTVVPRKSKRLSSRRLNSSTHPQTLRKDAVQQEASNVQPIIETTVNNQVSDDVDPHQVQIEGVSSPKKQPFRSIKLNRKRKRISAKSLVASKHNKRHNQKIGQSGDLESDDSDDYIVYKPSISWLNPMGIPATLVNLTKTRQKRSTK